ncbi:MAG: hypothetical protein M1823_002597 [Watsoniomyces obsoletus]|nr:MAG: hypothetical protein M1823_002597 [Watsoniomyces obsoletus]
MTPIDISTVGATQARPSITIISTTKTSASPTIVSTVKTRHGSKANKALNTVQWRSREKAAIFVAFPVQQVLLVAALQEMGIEAVAYHAGFYQIDRADLAATFYNEVNQPRRTAILSEPATSAAIERQATGRFRRKGQPYTVRVWQLYNANFWNSFQASNSRKKVLLGIMADLNRSVWSATAPGQDRPTLANFVLDET